MPPKLAKKSKNNSTSKNDLPKAPVLPEATNMNSASGLNPEAEDQFELELCWCVQQLETSLSSGKLQKKQAENIGKYLKSLKSNSASLIKKRQIMKNTLGDYREKMMEDERKLSKTASTVKFICSTSANTKSVFVKKAVQHNTKESNQMNDHEKEIEDKLINNKKTIIDSNDSQIPFQFNFQTCQ